MNKKILIIEADEKDRLGMTRTLATIGYNNVVVACTGQEGLKIIRSKKPDIVIIALALPDLKGFDVCKEIKCMEGIHSKVILITGKLNIIEPHWKRNSHADAFITKTASYESLTQAITKLI